MNKGILYIIATPIGNISDITFRAVDILKGVAFVLAEDTRVTGNLFKKYDINTTLVSYRDQNHDRMIEKIFEKLDMGLNLALVSDCGTPLISDPGYRLVSVLREKGYEVEAVPGASAVVSALSISGIPTDKFVFLGFLPKSDKRRVDILNRYLELRIPLVIYESPHRLKKLLEILKDFSDIEIVLNKDVTKKFEKYYRGTPVEILSQLKDDIKGEWVVTVNYLPNSEV